MAVPAPKVSCHAQQVVEIPVFVFQTLVVAAIQAAVEVVIAQRKPKDGEDER